MCLVKQTYHQRGETIMAQRILPFKYEEEKKTTGLMALAGLPLYLELAQKTGLGKSIQKHIKVRESGHGWTDSQILTVLILLNLAGGGCVDDLKVLVFKKHIRWLGNSAAVNLGGGFCFLSPLY